MATKIGSSGFKLYIGNLAWTVASRQLRDYFSQFGNITNAAVIFDKSSGMSRGFGFVTFSHEEALKAAQNKVTHILEGNVIHIRIANTPYNVE